MRKQLRKLIMIIGIVCLINTVYAQSGFIDDDSDDFFEFVVIEEPVVDEEEQVVPESSVEDDVSMPEESEEDTTNEEESVESAVVPMVSAEKTVPASEENNVPAENNVQASIEPSATSNSLSSAEVTTTNSTQASAEAVKETSKPETVAQPSTPETVVKAPEPVAETSEPVPSTPESVSETQESVSEDAENNDEEIEETPVDEKAPSRTVTIKKKQYLDVTYPGEGWLYMGDENNSKTLSFKGREQKGNSTLMKFYADRAGEALLHFCKQDILTDTYIHDYLLVTVSKMSGNKQHIEAPEYIPVPTVNNEEDIVSDDDMEPESSEVEEIEPEDQPEVSEAEPEIEEIIINSGISLADEPDVVFSFGDGIDFSGGDDDDYYQQLIDEANDAFFSGRGQEAVDKAQIVIDDGSYFSDEALYIQAQVYETDSTMLDVNKSYELYKIIVDYYPESAMWSKASKRVTYLERYYFSIR